MGGSRFISPHTSTAAMPTTVFGLSVLTSAAIAIGTASVTTATASRLGASHGPRAHGGHGGHGSAARACRVCALLELRGGLSFSSSSSPSPQAMMHAWRADRLDRFAASFDASRYHAQVLFVDDDGARARTCEALLERVAIWSDAGWWIYPHSATTSASGVPDGSAPLPSLGRSARELGLCPARLGARTARLQAADLLDYDLIVAVDFAVLGQVRSLVREAAVQARRGAGEMAAREGAVRRQLRAAMAGVEDAGAGGGGYGPPGRGRRTDAGRRSRRRTYRRTRRALRAQRLEAPLLALTLTRPRP